MKKCLLALLLVLACVCLSSCQLMDDFEAAMTDNVLSIVADKAEESGAAKLARQFVDGVLANDAEAALSAMVSGVTMESLLAVFPQMHAMLPEADSYTLTPAHWSTQSSDGVTMHAFQFQLTIENETFVVETLQMSGVEGLYNINIAPYAPDETAASSASASRKISAVELAFQFISLAAIVLIIWALVDCCRHKFKRRWLWILLILFANMLLTFSLSGSRISFNFNIGLYLTSNYLALSENGFAMQWMLPVGSLVYMLRRKHLLPPPSKGFAEAFPQSEQEAASTEEVKSPAESTE